MIIGSIKEQNLKETRIALTPSVTKKLTEMGHSILLEKNFGTELSYHDKEYILSGAKIIKSQQEIYKKCQTILQIEPPTNTLLQTLTNKQLLIADFRNFDLSNLYNNNRIIRLEKVLRTATAQNIDILSSQDTVRGYTAAICALYLSPYVAPQMMTAATTTKALNALVIGAGITGLQAALTLKRAGCRVTIADINEKNEDLAKSVGAKFVINHSLEDTQLLLAQQNIIITSAPSHNKKNIIIKKTQLQNISPNTVVIDTTPYNVEISDKNTLPFRFYRNPHFEREKPITASELWANNMLNLITLIGKTTDFATLNKTHLHSMIYPQPKKGATL